MTNSKRRPDADVRQYIGTLIAQCGMHPDAYVRRYIGTLIAQYWWWTTNRTGLHAQLWRDRMLKTIETLFDAHAAERIVMMTLDP